MAVARAKTGGLIDDYLEYSRSLAIDTQLRLAAMRELHQHSETMRTQIEEMTKLCLGMPHQRWSRSTTEEQRQIKKLLREIDSMHAKIATYCTQKVMLTQQRIHKMNEHLARLDDHLHASALELKKGGRIPQEEPAMLLLPTPTVWRRKRKGVAYLPERLGVDRDWERGHKEAQRESEQALLRVLSASHHYKGLPDSQSPDESDFDLAIDLNERLYCICAQCDGGEWFHYKCVGLIPQRRVKGKWYCPPCKTARARNLGQGSSAPSCSRCR